MCKSVVIHQPNFLPRMKVFIKIAISDIWVIYDDVQYVRREWQNRVFLRDAEQRSILFTAPVKKADFFEKINKIELFDPVLLSKLLYKHIRCNYSKSPYYKWVLSYLEAIDQETINITNLAAYNVICTNMAFKLLGINIVENYSSQLGVSTSDRNGKLIELCQKSKSLHYICGSGGRTYIDENAFKSAGINIIYYDYSKITQSGSYNLDYYRNHSFIDFVAYNGPETLYDIICREKQIQIEQCK